MGYRAHRARSHTSDHPQWAAHGGADRHKVPIGPNEPDATAGANFQLAYRSSFLLPHRRSAWIRFAERLDEIAEALEALDVVDVADADAADVLDRVGGNVRAASKRLAEQIESV